MLCLGIACSHVLSVKALPEPSLEGSVYCTLFSYDGFRSQPLKKRPNGKSNIIRRPHDGRMPCGQFRESAAMACQNRHAGQIRHCRNERNRPSALRIHFPHHVGHLLDKIILCTIPVIAGNGCRLFLGDLPESEWMRDETKTYKDGAIKAVYRKNEGATVQKVNTSKLKRLFRL